MISTNVFTGYPTSECVCFKLLLQQQDINFFAILWCLKYIFDVLPLILYFKVDINFRNYFLSHKCLTKIRYEN